MTYPDSVTIRPVTADEFAAFTAAVRAGFGSDGPPVDTSGRFIEMLPPERTIAAFDGDDIVGTFGGYDFEVTVPGGGTLPMESTTVVTVFPTHRRRGLLTAMMAMHLDHAADRGYPLAGLWSSDSDIYARFGYGIAAYYREISMHASRIVMRDEVSIDRVRRISAEEAAVEAPVVFDRVRRQRAGMFGRPESWWRHRIIADDEWMRDGKTARRWVVHDGSEGIDGYAAYRQKAGFAEGFADGTVSVVEFCAETSEAAASLWSYLTEIDGFPNVEWWNLSVDDPLEKMVREPRRVRTTKLRDSLWIRILDVPAALEARTYETDLSLTIGIEDPFRPATSGNYRIVVASGSATVERTDSEPDVVMDIDVAGSLYLGGQNVHAFAEARRVVGEPGAIAATQRLFATQRAPWCQDVF
ncbi:MAG: GNAT family N-acetyltransferase [Acidimicrobiia bacterium]|nr:GNAT family N-acetyltransferase [Acidimicrobiia bacterium]